MRLHKHCSRIQIIAKTYPHKKGRKIKRKACTTQFIHTSSVGTIRHVTTQNLKSIGVRRHAMFQTSNCFDKNIGQQPGHKITHDSANGGTILICRMMKMHRVVS